jgi:serine/threonine protein kinase
MNLKEMVGMNVKIHAMNYQITGVIGEGAASIVYLAKNQTGKNVAIKKIKDYKNPIIKEAVDKEIKIQKSFEGCPYVIQYLGV